MTASYDSTTKGARMQKVIDAIDGGPGNGVLVIGSSSLSGATGVLAQIPLQKPSFSQSGGVITLLGVPLSDTSADASGTAAKAEFRDSTGAVKVSGLTVGTSGSDINLNSTAISSGQTVTITSGTITHAA